jgi:hypothetical protein
MSQQASDAQKAQAAAEQAKAEAARAETERLKQEADRKAQENAAANSPYEQGRQIALFGAPAAGGIYFGYRKGAGLSEGVNNRATERAANIGNLAQSVRSGEVPQSAALKTAQKLRLLGPSEHGYGPLGFGGALAAWGGAQRALAPELTDNPIGQDVIRGTGGLESGIGTGLLFQQIGSIMKGVKQPEAKDIATIEEPPPAPPPPPDGAPSGPKAGTRPALYADAKARGLPVTTRMTKAELTDILTQAMKKAAKNGSKAVLPLTAGYGVYDALTNPSEAADGSAPEPMSKGEAAAIGAGTGAATGYGWERLKRALKGIPLGPAAGIAGEMTMPFVAADAYDPTPEELNRDRNTLARHLPSWMQFGAIKDAADMSQVPPRNPDRVPPYAPPLMQAAALEIPKDIPAGVTERANIESGMHPPAPPQPSFGSAPLAPHAEHLLAATANDPELAELVRQAIRARLQGAQTGG